MALYIPAACVRTNDSHDLLDERFTLVDTRSHPTVLSADHHDLCHFVGGEVGQTQLDELLLAEHLVYFCKCLLEGNLSRR